VEEWRTGAKMECDMAIEGRKTLSQDKWLQRYTDLKGSVVSEYRWDKIP